MFIKEYKKSNGEIIKIPEDIKLTISETSNNAYQMDMFCVNGVIVSHHVTDLDNMVEQALLYFKNMKK